MANLEQRRRMICKTYILINENLSTYKAGNKTKKSVTQLSYYEGTIAKTMLIFAKNMPNEQNYRGAGTETYFFWSYVCLSTYVPNLKLQV